MSKLQLSSSAANHISHLSVLECWRASGEATCTSMHACPCCECIIMYLLSSLHSEVIVSLHPSHRLTLSAVSSLFSLGETGNSKQMLPDQITSTL